MLSQVKVKAKVEVKPPTSNIRSCSQPLPQPEPGSLEYRFVIPPEAAEASLQRAESFVASVEDYLRQTNAGGQGPRVSDGPPTEDQSP